MSNNYIYHIYSRTQIGSGIYIGQTHDGPVERPIAHFIGGFPAEGKHSVENHKFLNMLKTTELENIQIDVFAAPNYGLPAEELDRFVAEWYQSYRIFDNASVKKSENGVDVEVPAPKFNDDIRLNAAEILHTYYYTRIDHRYGRVTALSFGGQQEAMFSRKSGIVLSRNLDPETAATILESDGQTSMKLGDLQKQFQASMNNRIKKQQLGEDLLNIFINNLASENSRSAQRSKLYRDINAYMVKYFRDNLETVIRDMQDYLYGHVSSGFRISWPDGHAVKFANGDASELYSMADVISSHFTNHLNRIQAEIDSKTSLQDQIKVIAEAAAQAIRSISIATFAEIRPKDNFQRRQVISSVGSPDRGNPEEIERRLKLKSYDYFRRIADEAFNLLQGQYGQEYPYHLLHTHSDEGFTDYRILRIPQLSKMIYQEYVARGLQWPCLKNYQTWIEFSRGLMTMYTKTHGTIFNSVRGYDSPYNYNLLLVDEGEDEYEYYVAYQFSRETWNFMQENENIMIKDLPHY